MITQIAMLPPTQPAPDSQASSAPAPAKQSGVASDSASSATTTTQNSPADFKQVLHSARGKHKATQNPTNQAPTDKKTASVVAAKGKPATTQTAAPATTEDDDTTTEAATQVEASEEEVAETQSKTPTTTTTPTTIPLSPKFAKTVAKKPANDSSESESDPSTPEAAQAEVQTNAVQAISPDARQSHSGKQQKPAEKTLEKTEPSVLPAKLMPATTPVPSTIATAHIVPNPAVNNSATPVPSPATANPDSTTAPANAPLTSTPANQTGIQPHSAGHVGKNYQISIDNTLQPSDSTNAADAASDATDADTDIESSGDSGTVASAATTPAPAPTPTNQTAVKITDALAALSNVLPTHAPESASPTASSAPVSPTRSFADANQDQIVTTIKGQLLPDGGSMQITLHPANLGHVRISVQVTGGSVSATFETNSDQATRLLSHNLSQLKQTLESAGVTVEKLQVTQSRDTQSQTQSDSRQSGSQQQSATDERTSQQEQQRREILQQMWDKIAGSKDWIDVKA